VPHGSPSLAIAQQVVDLALETAQGLMLRIAVVVVDRGGHPVALARMDGVGFINVEVARRKAVAGMNFGAPTHDVTELLGRDQLLVGALGAMDDHIITLPGGFPLAEVTTVVGGFGIAGGHYQQDREIGEKVVATLAAAAIGGGA
jgi:glc operon protein GlcG